MREPNSRAGGKPPARSGLAVAIASRIKQNGPITFAEFMEMALYSPGLGYYTSGKRAWGPEGDYITSLDVSPVFQKAIARQIIEFWELLGSPGDFELIEAGAGRGWLSKGILNAAESSPPFHKALKIRFVERNETLHEPPSEKVSWHSSLEGLPAAAFGCFITNELIDSFPVHRVEFLGGKLRELYVDSDGSSFVEVPGLLSDPAIEDYFKRVGVEPFEGMRTEVNLEAIKWLGKAASLLGKGFVMTIDYGLPARELYSEDRRGSLMCHFRHTLNCDPFANIGAQDITTHADFTALAVYGRDAGLETSGFTTQKNFLIGLGILNELKTPASLDSSSYDDINFNRAIARLIAPGGMGDTFKVLIQRKGVPQTPLLGFSFREMSRSLGLK